MSAYNRGAISETPLRRYREFFRALGARYRRLRRQRGMVQREISQSGLALRHYQRIEAGRPHTLTTLFRLAECFQLAPSKLLAGIDPPRSRQRPTGPNP